MKHSILTTAIATAMAFAFAAAPADAKNNGKHKRGHDRGPDRVMLFADRGDRHHPRHHRGNNPKAQGRHDNGLHLGWYKQRWHRGDRIPVRYLERRYYIDDYRPYREYGLYAPPEGYRWVRPMDDRYLLVQVATGLVLEALGY